MAALAPWGKFCSHTVFRIQGALLKIAFSFCKINSIDSIIQKTLGCLRQISPSSPDSHSQNEV